MIQLMYNVRSRVHDYNIPGICILWTLGNPCEIFVGLITLHCVHTFANLRYGSTIVTRIMCQQMGGEVNIACGQFHRLTCMTMSFKCLHLCGAVLLCSQLAFASIVNINNVNNCGYNTDFDL